MSQSQEWSGGRERSGGRTQFCGLFTALVTPFTGGAPDEAAFRRLVRGQLDADVDGLVPCGTTGEAPTLTIAERLSVIRWTVEEAAGAVPVVAGIGGNNTAATVEMARQAAAVGVQGVLATAPYYNKPTQEGLRRHFTAIAQAVPETGVCLYDVPGRSTISIHPGTVAALSETGNVIALKDATGDLCNATRVLRCCGDRLSLLSGDDFTTLPFIAVGGSGCISVASNVVPGRMKRLVDAARAGELPTARAEHSALFPLFHALFLQSNPIPVKAAMADMGLISQDLRLPLCEMDAEPRAALRAVLRELSLLG